jgi:Tfp pilus assembly protein PilV
MAKTDCAIPDAGDRGEVVMVTSRAREASPLWTGPTDQAGITLVEVLVAIFVSGIGLLALLTLFPLGALELAQAVKDDRTAAVAANAKAVSEAGKALLARTNEFVITSATEGSADPQAAAQLRKEADELGARAAELESEIEALPSLVRHPRLERHLPPLLAQIRSIKQHLATLSRLLSLAQ